MLTKWVRFDLRCLVSDYRQFVSEVLRYIDSHGETPETAKWIDRHVGNITDTLPDDAFAEGSDGDILLDIKTEALAGIASFYRGNRQPNANQLYAITESWGNIHSSLKKLMQSALARRVVKSFQQAASEAVEAHKARGEPVVGEVDGVWQTIKSR